MKDTIEPASLFFGATQIHWHISGNVHCFAMACTCTGLTLGDQDMPHDFAPIMLRTPAEAQAFIDWLRVVEFRSETVAIPGVCPEFEAESMEDYDATALTFEVARLLGVSGDEEGWRIGQAMIWDAYPEGRSLMIAAVQWWLDRWELLIRQGQLGMLHAVESTTSLIIPNPERR